MKSNTLWALIAGLAVGLLVGRELPRSGGGGSGTGGTDTAKADVKAGSAAVGGGAAPGVVPADWLKEEDLKAGDKMAGMTAGQKYAVLKVMNEKPCDCGCPHGNTAKCLKDDPNCPRAPKILETAIALAKQGKSVDEILAAVKKPADAPGAAPPAGAPQKVEVAAWSPVKGPKNAKVTIVEFSDFQ